MNPEDLVAAVADNPQGRLELAQQFYEAVPSCDTFGRAQGAFMHWAIARGALNPPQATPPGSPWWRAVNSRLLLDQTGARLTREAKGAASCPQVQFWMDFLDEPSSVSWYRAHNASVATGYLESAHLAAEEPASEQWFINLVLVRVLYAQACGDGSLKKAVVDDLASALTEPTGHGIQDALRLRTFYPSTYPAPQHHAWWSSFSWEHIAEWVVDRHMVLPHTNELLKNGASTLGLQELTTLASNDVPCYPWPLLNGGGTSHVKSWLQHAESRLTRHNKANTGTDTAPLPTTRIGDIEARAVSIINQTAHRTSPVPQRSWLAYQRWANILFLHWVLEADELAKVRALVPEELEIDTFEGKAYLALVPLLMEDVHLRHLPAIGLVSNFAELNFRTYVTCKGRPGVWFFTLDASSYFDVWVGRHVFHLPYEASKAQVVHSPTDDYLSFESNRDVGWEGATPGTPPVDFCARYRPTGAGAAPQPNTLESFLCERYLMFANDAHKGLLMGEIHHLPWQLFEAEVDLSQNSVPNALGLTLNRPPDSTLYSPLMENMAWSMVRA
jgi:uncharacterized protein YqjF (DUF2071 family)